MEKQILTEEEVKNIVVGPGSERDRALFATLYLSNSRVGEIVRRLQRYQLVFRTIDNIPYLLFDNLYTEKNRKHPRRVVPVIVSEDKECCQVIQAYSNGMAPDEVVFPIGRQRSWQIMKRLCGKGNHDLRHTRLTHLTVRYDLDGSDKKVIAGWTDERPNSAYTHLQWRKVANRMKRNMEG